jgi:hypothetical protein
MEQLNFGRIVKGGLVAALVNFLIENVSNILFYYQRMVEPLRAHGLHPILGPPSMVLGAGMCILTGCALVFFYAVAKDRFGAGTRTAVVIALALYLGFYVPGLLDFYMIGLYPFTLIEIWAACGLVELVAASIVGARIYRARPTIAATRVVTS